VLEQPYSPKQAMTPVSPSRSGKSWLHNASIRKKIGAGYALAISLTIVGTTTGLKVGNFYQNKAQHQLAHAVKKEQLLNEMQRNVLHMRLHQHEVIPLIKQPALFKDKHAHFLTHIDKIRKVIPQIKSLVNTTDLDNLQFFLKSSSEITEAYSDQMESLLDQVDPSKDPNLNSAEIQSRQEQLLKFTTSETTLKFDSLLNELIAFIQKAQISQQQAEKDFEQAQILRTQVIGSSMLLSSLITIALALYTSRAIARPLEGVTQIAQRVIKENDFSLQAPVTTKDEVGVLATSLNQLITWVAEYTQELELARQTLEKRVEERTDELKRKNTELHLEREKSERLLLNILPKDIADRLKLEESNIADSFPCVTVMFGDIVNFTQVSSQVSARELVSLLNKIFSKFDLLAHQHNLEKIKTIGDAYMVVGGIPNQRLDHPEAIAEMALDMQKAIAEFNLENNRSFSMRIGIHTGPVVAGVIGTQKFIYDLWGDTVNIASRMESHGFPDCIQVTAATYERLQDNYVFEERGLVQVKGKGEMKTYFLKGRKQVVNKLSDSAQRRVI
jgi:adenylate cyclase